MQKHNDCLRAGSHPPSPGCMSGRVGRQGTGSAAEQPGVPQLARLSDAAGMRSRAPPPGGCGQPPCPGCVRVAQADKEQTRGVSSLASCKASKSMWLSAARAHAGGCLPSSLPSASLAGSPSGLRLSTLLRLRLRLRREDSSLKVLAVGASCGVCLAGPCCRPDLPRPGLLVLPPAGATGVACCAWPANDRESWGVIELQCLVELQAGPAAAACCGLLWLGLWLAVACCGLLHMACTESVWCRGALGGRSAAAKCLAGLPHRLPRP